MAYRYTASGRLEIVEGNVDTVCNILSSKRIGYEREGNAVCIRHDERAATPGEMKAEEAFEDVARYIEKPTTLSVSNELVGEYELGFVDGRMRMDEAMHVWATGERVPSPDELVGELRARGIAATVIKTKGRKGGRRARMYHVQPGSGGPACKVTVKRRFWDSYDLLSVPDIHEPLCRRYHMSPAVLRENLRNATFGLEVRKPALGNASSDMIFEALLDVIEDITEGIRTELG